MYSRASFRSPDEADDGAELAGLDELDDELLPLLLLPAIAAIRRTTTTPDRRQPHPVLLFFFAADPAPPVAKPPYLPRADVDVEDWQLTQGTDSAPTWLRRPYSVRAGSRTTARGYRI